MRKIIVLALALAISAGTYAQTEEGSFLIEANTSFASIGGVLGGGTGFTLSSTDGSTIWNIGGEGGYFVKDNLALKFGLGYGDIDGITLFSWRVGAKYYVNNSIPFQVDFTGQNSDELFFGENSTYLGLQGGYAIFIGESKRVSFEPSLRYNISLNSDFFDDIFQIQAGFAIFL